MQLSKKRFHRQVGMSMLSWIALIALIGVFAITLIKLAPIYLEYYSVVSITKSMQEEPSLKGQALPVIKDVFIKRLDMSNVKSLTSKGYSFKKAQGKKAFVIEIDYEVRTPLFGNLFIVAAFQHSTEVGG